MAVDTGNKTAAALKINPKPVTSFKANGSMTEKRRNREIKKRIVLKGTTHTLQASELVALLWALNEAISHPKVGFNHATTDVQGWLSSITPHGVSLDTAFLEDLLYSANMLTELNKYKHPLGKSFDETLRLVLKPGETFNKDINEICRKK